MCLCLAVRRPEVSHWVAGDITRLRVTRLWFSLAWREWGIGHVSLPARSFYLGFLESNTEKCFFPKSIKISVE